MAGASIPERGHRASLSAGAKRARHTDTRDGLPRSERLTLVAWVAEIIPVEQRVLSVRSRVATYTPCSFQPQGAMNCDKATSSPASHRSIQCVWIPESSSTGLEPTIPIDDVHLAALGSRKAVSGTFVALLLEICEGFCQPALNTVRCSEISAYRHSTYNFMGSDPHTPSFEDSEGGHLPLPWAPSRGR